MLKIRECEDHVGFSVVLVLYNVFMQFNPIKIILMYKDIQNSKELTEQLHKDRMAEREDKQMIYLIMLKKLEYHYNQIILIKRKI